MTLDDARAAIALDLDMSATQGAGLPVPTSMHRVAGHPSIYGPPNRGVPCSSQPDRPAHSNGSNRLPRSPEEDPDLHDHHGHAAPAVCARVVGALV